MGVTVPVFAVELQTECTPNAFPGATIKMACMWKGEESIGKKSVFTEFTSRYHI